MPLTDPKVITLMLKNGQPAKILFKTKQWRAECGNYQDKQWRLVICGDTGTVSETEMGKAGDFSPGLWVREFKDTDREGTQKFFRFQQMTGVRMLQPTEFLRAAGDDPAAFKLQLPVQQQATYLLPAYEDGASRNNWEEGVRGGFWLEAADAAAASAAAFQASTQSSARAVVTSGVVGNKYCYTDFSGAGGGGGGGGGGAAGGGAAGGGAVAGGNSRADYNAAMDGHDVAADAWAGAIARAIDDVLDAVDNPAQPNQGAFVTVDVLSAPAAAAPPAAAAAVPGFGLGGTAFGDAAPDAKRQRNA